MHWRIGSMPELDHLAPDARRALLRRHVGWFLYLRLGIGATLLGVVIGAVGSTVVLGYRPGDGGALGTAVFIGVAAVATAAFYQLMMVMIRVYLRAQIVAAAGDEGLPACLRCGFDLFATEGDRCPECGARVRRTGSRSPGKP